MAINVFKKDSFVELTLANGIKLTGILCNQGTNDICIRQDDGNIVTVTQEMLTQASYLYVGYPNESTTVKVPSMMIPNGKIESFNGKMGFAIDNEGRRLVIHPDSFLFDDEMKANAINNPNLLKDSEVILVMRELNEGITKKAYIFTVDTIDNTIDKMASLAAAGKVDIAILSCKLLLKDERLKNDEELLAFLTKLQASTAVIDFYRPILTKEQEEQARKDKSLCPLGRIIDVTRNKEGVIKDGHIIDTNSHEKLFFFGGQLFGRLANLPDEMLIGQPVVYSISHSKDGKSYQARSIIVPMKFSDAYSMAEDMHYDNTMPVNACDILRIILSQTEDEDIEQDLAEWIQGANVRGKLWILASPKPYEGQQKSLIPNMHNNLVPVILERQNSHTHDEKRTTVQPERPLIILRDNITETTIPVAEEIIKTNEERQEEQNDIASQAKMFEIQKEYEKAIEIYMVALNGSTKPQLKGEYIRGIIDLYSKQYNTSDEKQSKETIEKYRIFANKYLDGVNNRGFWLKENNLLNLDCRIQYYADMNETNNLIHAYEKKIALLEKLPQRNNEERDLLPVTRTELAWVYIRSGMDKSKAKTLIKEAQKDSAYDNQLWRICNAVLQEQEDIVNYVRSDISFIEHQPITERNLNDEVSHWNKIISIAGPYSKNRNLGNECFVLLAKIYAYSLLNRDTKIRILEPLCQYLIAILSKDLDQYEVEKKRWVVKNSRSERGQQIYDSCLAEKLSDCLNKNGSGMWRHWKDIRLIAALSREAAYKLCTLLYHLNNEAFAEVMRQSGVNVGDNTSEMSLSTFAKNFNEWRGNAYFEHYKKLRSSTRELVNNTTDLTRCANYLKTELKHEVWMQQADSKLIDAMRNQLSTLLSDYQNASQGSRKRILTSQEIKRRINLWRDDLAKAPTFLSNEILDYLLKCVLNIINRQITKYQEPQFTTRVISTSLVKPDGTVRIEVEVANEESKAKQVTDCRLMVLYNNVKEIRSIKSPYTYDDDSNVFSGEKLIYIIQGKLPLSMQTQSEGSIRLRLTYRVDDGKKEKSCDFECKFPIQLWSKDSSTIANVYVPSKPAHDHFYGRDDQVREVVSAINSSNSSPHYFIYGQKRSGKSSILYHIKKELESKNKFLCIEMDFSRFGNVVSREEDIYYEILKKIQYEYKLNYNFQLPKNSNKKELPLFDLPDKSEMGVDLFCTIMGSIKRQIETTKGWENYQLVLFIDEFTTVYEWCKDEKRSVTETFFTHWKSIQATGYFSAVLIGQDILRSIMNVAVDNDLSGYCFMKLDYLKREDARLIVTQPIIELTGNSNIFLGESIERILDYTASSAYYTKHVCHELINHINSNSLQAITEADVEESIREFFKNDAGEVQLLFDPLEFSGRSTYESDFTKEENRSVLQKVAFGELANPEYGCPRVNINLEKKGLSDKRVEEILKELVDRNVITEKFNYYSINVKLYLLWISQQIER